MDRTKKEIAFHLTLEIRNNEKFKTLKPRSILNQKLPLNFFLP